VGAESTLCKAAAELMLSRNGVRIRKIVTFSIVVLAVIIDILRHDTDIAIIILLLGIYSELTVMQGIKEEDDTRKVVKGK
jgi:hypothetical protein